MPTKQTIKDYLNRMTRAAKLAMLGDLLDDLVTAHNATVTALSNQMLGAAGLAIKAGGSPTVKAANAINAVAGGAAVYKAANTDMAALAGTLATAKSAAWAFYVDAAGTLSVSAKTADAASASAALALLPAVPANKTLVGYLTVANATGADFVGGTTAIDTASLTITYYNPVGIAGKADGLTVAELGAR
jgi:hypothetical protein